MDEHDIVSALKRLTAELGRAPTRAEFCAATRGADLWLKKMGGFTALLQASGLPTYSDRQSSRELRSISNNPLFEKSIEKHLEGYKAKLSIVPSTEYPSIAVISDIHWPFDDKRTVDRFLEYVGDKKPDWVIINGDAWDFYSHAKFPRSYNVFTPRDEQRLAREKNAAFWLEIRRIAPNAQCVQTLGNHDVRPLKRVMERYPEAEDWIKDKLAELFTFEGVRTIYDHREEFLIGDVMIFHGYRSKLGDHRDFTGYNTVNGHSHVGGVVFKRLHGKTLWELNSGFAGDPQSKGLSYTPQRTTQWTLGFGAVDRLGPRFIPV